MEWRRLLEGEGYGKYELWPSRLGGLGRNGVLHFTVRYESRNSMKFVHIVAIWPSACTAVVGRQKLALM